MKIASVIVFFLMALIGLRAKDTAVTVVGLLGLMAEFFGARAAMWLNRRPRVSQWAGGRAFPKTCPHHRRNRQ